MTFVINGTTGATQSASFDSASTFGFKNRIINGAMMIDQRNAGASVTPVDGAYTLDRWKFGVAQTSKLTTQQSSTAPAGFTNSMLVTSSSAYTVLTGDYFYFNERIEGYNIADLAWGTASAVPVTISFWVRSSLTGTFGGSVQNSAGTRSYPFTYTINSANTFEYKTITVAGETTGTWVTNNGIGIELNFGLGVGTTYSGTAGTWGTGNYLSATGSVSVVGTNGATFYITGVQLEKGSTATSFDYRPYGTELALCQRYYETSRAYYFTGASGGYVTPPYAVVKRATPTITVTADTSWTGGAATTVSMGSGAWNSSSTIGITNSSSGHIGAIWTASAEL